MLIVICGATATGKSSLALQIAQNFNSIIISADSRQVYREFDLGTAKPSFSEQKLVPHYLIDICKPTETLTLAEYQQQAQHLIDSYCFSKTTHSSLPLLVGGTGLYLKSIVKGLKIPRVSPHRKLRSQLLALGQKQLYDILRQVDPVAAGKIHLNDKTRIIRALEVFYVTGKAISIQQGENPPKYPILQIGLDCEPEVLKQRIESRTYKMIEMGLVAEVENLCQKYGQDLPLLNTLGYSEIKQYLAGDIDLNRAITLTITHTCQFAKRQRTWFRGERQIEWFDITSPNLLEQVTIRIKEFIKMNCLE